MCLKFDVDVFENASFPWIVTFRTLFLCQRIVENLFPVERYGFAVLYMKRKIAKVLLGKGAV